LSEAANLLRQRAQGAALGRQSGARDSRRLSSAVEMTDSRSDRSCGVSCVTARLPSFAPGEVAAEGPQVLGGSRSRRPPGGVARRRHRRVP